MKQQSGDTWTEEDGTQVQAKRITSTEKWMEKNAIKALNRARKAETALVDLKLFMESIAADAYAKALKEKSEITEEELRTRGSQTWYNFDRSIKIETDVQARHTFDEEKTRTCEEKFVAFLNGIQTEDTDSQLLKDLVKDSFKKSGTKYDIRKLEGLLKYKAKAQNKDFLSMLSELEGCRVPLNPKVYHRVWKKDYKGDYKQVQLNFSSIEISQDDNSD